MSERNQWKWFGHAGHFICGHDCRFHLCTLVGEYLVSTVGEYWPDSQVRMIHARIHDPDWFAKNGDLLGDNFDSAYMERFGYQDIGWNRRYETMVFATKLSKCCADTNVMCNCGMPDLIPRELEFRGYHTAEEAASGHMQICEHWKNGIPDEIADEVLQKISAATGTDSSGEGEG